MRWWRTNRRSRRRSLVFGVENKVIGRREKVGRRCRNGICHDAAEERKKPRRKEIRKRRRPYAVCFQSKNNSRPFYVRTLERQWIGFPLQPCHPRELYLGFTKLFCWPNQDLHKCLNFCTTLNAFCASCEAKFALKVKKIGGYRVQ